MVMISAIYIINSLSFYQYLQKNSNTHTPRTSTADPPDTMNDPVGADALVVHNLKSFISHHHEKNQKKGNDS